MKKRQRKLKKYKLLSFQPFSLYNNGGGARILRRLYSNYESDVYSLVIANEHQKYSGIIKEHIIHAFPVTRRWMRWKIRDLIFWLRYNFFKKITNIIIQNHVKKIDFEILHVVNHGSFSTSLCNYAENHNKKIWASFHDHFSACSSYSDAEELWKISDRRLVISEELGQEYVKLFGLKNYEIITDGVLEHELSSPVQYISKTINIYFAGLVHIDYVPLFNAFANALEELIKEGYKIKIIIRGTLQIKCLNNRLVEVEYRKVTLNEEELNKERDDADILYLPIKFTNPGFYKYSLSTKMVGYLAARGIIFYHGPEDSAACKLLKKNNAAVCCTSLKEQSIINAFNNLLINKNRYSHNSKELAKKNFMLRDIQSRFWQNQYA